MKKIVIIGSGINGLVASNYLAKEDYDVTVIDKNSYTGGAVSYTHLTLPTKA